MRTFEEFMRAMIAESKQLWAKELLDESKDKWIQGAIKHPGRCTKGSPNFDCPKGSPQWKLAQRFKHGDIHKANIKKGKKSKKKKS